MGSAWARTPVRLFGLLGLLAAVASFGVPRIINELSGASASPACSVGVVPQPIKETAAGVVRAVTASGLAALVGRGSLDVEGFQQPSAAAWLDVPPPGDESQIRASTVIDGGYEIRWWSPEQDHQGASLFVFRSADAAARYVREAASSRCRRHAKAYRLSQPERARAIVWVNPLDVIQADVYFSRGDRAYRLIEVAPNDYQPSLSGLGARLQIGVAQLLACELKDARCQRST